MRCNIRGPIGNEYGVQNRLVRRDTLRKGLRESHRNVGSWIVSRLCSSTGYVQMGGVTSPIGRYEERRWDFSERDQEGR